MNGFYSGFPSCCIAYFCKLKQRGLFPSSYVHWKYPDMVNNNAQYVQCKKCMESKIYLKKTQIRKGFIHGKNFRKIARMGFEFFETKAKRIFQQILEE